MNFPDAKKLKKLADACRKAGIKSFKSPEFEFTLTDELPERKPRGKAAPKPQYTQDDVKVEGALSEEDMLFWSVTNTEKLFGEKGQEN